VFEKLYKFIGKDIKSLIDRPDGQYCFRLHKNRIFYVSESIMKRATNVSSMRWLIGGVGACCCLVRCVRGRKVACERACGCGLAAVGSQVLTPFPHLPPSADRGHTNPTPTTADRPQRKHQVGRDQLVFLGSCVGKLTHSGKFRLTIGALEILAQFAKHKVRGVTPCVCGAVCASVDTREAQSQVPRKTLTTSTLTGQPNHGG